MRRYCTLHTVVAFMDVDLHCMIVDYYDVHVLTWGRHEHCYDVHVLTWAGMSTVKCAH